MQRIGGDNIVFRRPDLHGAGDIFWLYCSWDLGKIFILGPFPVPLIGNRPSVCHRGASIQGPCGCGILVRCRVKRKSERRNLRGCHRDNRRPRDAFFCIRPNRIDCGRPVLEGPRRSGGRRVAVSGRPWDIAPNASGQLLPVDCNGSPFCVCLCKKCLGRIILDVRSALRLRGEYWRGCPINGDGRRLAGGALLRCANRICGNDIVYKNALFLCARGVLGRCPSRNWLSVAVPLIRDRAPFRGRGAVQGRRSVSHIVLRPGQRTGECGDLRTIHRYSDSVAPGAGGIRVYCVGCRHIVFPAPHLVCRRRVGGAVGPVDGLPVRIPLVRDSPVRGHCRSVQGYRGITAVIHRPLQCRREHRLLRPVDLDGRRVAGGTLLVGAKGACGDDPVVHHPRLGGRRRVGGAGLPRDIGPCLLVWRGLPLVRERSRGRGGRAVQRRHRVANGVGRAGQRGVEYRHSSLGDLDPGRIAGGAGRVDRVHIHRIQVPRRIQRLRWRQAARIAVGIGGDDPVVHHPRLGGRRRVGRSRRSGDVCP